MKTIGRAFAALTILVAAILPSVTFAGTNTYCGRKQSVDGTVVLADDKGKPILELSDRGGDQPLYEQANEILGKKMKDGQAYCLTVMMNAAGSPIKVLKAKPDLLAKEKKTIVTPGAPAGGQPLPTTDPKATEKLKEVPPAPVDVSE